jgi:hypothetical protein
VKFDTMLYCRIDRPLKIKLRKEVRRRRSRGLAHKEADVTREALVEYFELRDRKAVTS